MPWKRVWRNVLLGLPGKPGRAVAEKALAEVGLGHRSGAWPKTLPGGEAQRASPYWFGEGVRPVLASRGLPPSVVAALGVPAANGRPASAPGGAPPLVPGGR